MRARLNKTVAYLLILGRRKAAPGLSPYRFAKKFRRFRTGFFYSLKNSVFIIIGIISAAFGLKGFLLPNQFIDGGATGISLLLNAISGIPIWIWLMLVNLPFIILGSNTISKRFAFKASLAIAGLAAALVFMDFPEVTEDKLLVAVFGGFFLGAGIGLSVRGGAVLDGTEVLALYLSRKTGLTVGDVVFGFNVLIFGAGAYFLSLEQALYSMLTYMAASKTLDFLIEGIEEYTGVTIVSAHSEEIRKMIINDMRRGVTIYKGSRGFSMEGPGQDVNIVYTVITRLEISRLNAEISKIDPNAFVVMNSIKDTKGGMIKKRPLKH
jgi:uncharacterized membrane-anchored protein YitT (DUF2179 family)